MLLAAAIAPAARPQQPAAAPATPSSSPSSFPSAQPGPAQANPVQTGSISGSVVDRDGTVYEDARAVLASSDSHGPALTQATDSNGRFSFTALAAGAYTLTVSGKGFAPQTRSIVLNPGQSYEAQPIVLVASSTTNVRVTAYSSSIEIAQEEVQLEEKQRVLGFIPNFYVAYDPHAPPLDPRQKFNLAWKTAIDPVSFLAAGAFAGIEQADNMYSGYGQGAQGYAKRFGATFADEFSADILGNEVFPVLLHQDPRYFYKGTGTIRSRALYAIATAVICKGDNGRWQPNYSGILGALAAGGLSNLYYPASDRNGVGLTFENTLIGVAGGAVQGIFQEFVVRRLTPHLPSYNSSGH